MGAASVGKDRVEFGAMINAILIGPKTRVVGQVGAADGARQSIAARLHPRRRISSTTCLISGEANSSHIALRCQASAPHSQPPRPVQAGNRKGRLGEAL